MDHKWFNRCLYLAKLNPVTRFGRVAQLEEHWTDDVEIVGSSPLYATIFFSNNVRFLANVFTGGEPQ